MVNGALVQIIMASRMFYGMARKGMLWSGLARLHGKTRTPVVATLLVLVIILVLALWLPMVKLAAGTSFLVLGVFMLVNASLLAIKWRESGRQIKQYYPIWVPVAGLCSSLGLVISQVTLV